MLSYIHDFFVTVSEKIIAVKNGSLWDGTGSDPLNDTVVLVKGNTIIARAQHYSTSRSEQHQASHEGRRRRGR